MTHNFQYENYIISSSWSVILFYRTDCSRWFPTGVSSVITWNVWWFSNRIANQSNNHSKLSSLLQQPNPYVEWMYFNGTSSSSALASTSDTMGNMGMKSSSLDLVKTVSLLVSFTKDSLSERFVFVQVLLVLEQWKQDFVFDLQLNRKE